jgi:tRNA(Ile)-lysidine synthase
MLKAQFDDFMSQNFDKAISSGVALAVSGGADSIAMLFLASNWAKNNSINLTIFSVDHKLRAESVSELEFVRETVMSLGHEFIPLEWRHSGQKTSIQERARDARYNMMSEKCHELSINTLLTAHHYDDFLENYLMRKNKKSGILGLSNSESMYFNNIQVLRPFCSIKKKILVDYLNSNSIKWVEDSSNNSDLYERNVIRKQLASFSAEESRSLEIEVEKVSKQAHDLNERFIEAIAKIVQFNNFGFANINLELYKKLDHEIAVYLINFVLTNVSGKLETPRYRSVEKLVKNITSGDCFDCSLHGCILRGVSNKLMIFREKSAIDIIPKSLKSGSVWDGRFRLDIENKLGKESYKIEPLSKQDYIKIKEKLDFKKLPELSNNNHKDILFTLPVIKNLEKVVAIPHISYYDDFEPDFRIKIVFRPGFISRFTHFL